MAISKIKLGSADAVELRDDTSLHYRGHFTAGLEAGANNTYTGTPTGLTAIAELDFITYGTENINLVCTNISSDTTPVITWTSTSEATAENALAGITVNGVANVTPVADHVAAVTLDAAHVAVEDTNTPANNILPAFLRTGNLTASSEGGALANKKYVDDTTILAGHMKFIGTVGIGGDKNTLPLTPSTAAVGDTYKVFVAGTYNIDNASTPTTIDAKVGDLFICKVSNADANPSNPSVVYSYVPSGDDVAVTSVDVSAGLSITLPSGQQSSAIKTTGTINLKLVGGNTPLSGTVSAATGTYRTLPVGVDTTNGNLATAVPAGTLAEVLVNSEAKGTAVASISNTGATGTGAGAFLAAHVGKTPEDADTLYIDYITPVATTANVVTYTAS